MKVLVTGHHGYLGSVTVPVLQEAGHEVVGLDTFFYEGCDLVGDAGTPVRAIRADVRDVGPPELAGFDAVVHLAALSNDPLGDLDRELTLEINHRASVRLAEAAREAGVGRFVFASSCSMYGTAGETGAIDEDAPLAPLTAYAESKVRAEADLAELAGEDFSPVFMRNATVYGVSPRIRLDVVLNNLGAWAFTTRRVRILSDGSPWRPIVHVEDVARATAAILEAPREVVHGRAFNIGGDSENYQVRELADMVGEAAGCEVEYAGSGDPDPRSYRVDFGRFARAFPDVELRWNARRGVDELLGAYGEAGLTRDAFEGDRYVRLRRLSSLLGEGRIGDDLRWRSREALGAGA